MATTSTTAYKSNSVAPYANRPFIPALAGSADELVVTSAALAAMNPFAAPPGAEFRTVVSGRMPSPASAVSGKPLAVMVDVLGANERAGQAATAVTPLAAAPATGLAAIEESEEESDEETGTPAAAPAPVAAAKADQVAVAGSVVVPQEQTPSVQTRSVTPMLQFNRNSNIAIAVLTAVVGAALTALAVAVAVGIVSISIPGLVISLTAIVCVIGALALISFIACILASVNAEKAKKEIANLNQAQAKADAAQAEEAPETDGARVA